MTLEQLMALGLDKPTAEKVINLYTSEGHIPKNRFDQVNAEKNNYKKELDTLKTDITALKESATTVEQLKTDLAQATEKIKTMGENHAAEVSKIQKEVAIDKDLASANLHEVGIVKKLLDLDKVIVGTDGKIVGLNEQLESLKTSSPYLFKQTDPATPNPGTVPPGVSIQGKTPGVGGSGIEDKASIGKALASSAKVATGNLSDIVKNLK